MSDLPRSFNVIKPKGGSVIVPKAWMAMEQPDPTKDPAWVLWATMFYGPENADPNEAYEELAERDRQHGIAS